MYRCYKPACQVWHLHLASARLLFPGNVVYVYLENDSKISRAAAYRSADNILYMAKTNNTVRMAERSKALASGASS